LAGDYESIGRYHTINLVIRNKRLGVIRKCQLNNKAANEEAGFAGKRLNKK